MERLSHFVALVVVVTTALSLQLTAQVRVLPTDEAARDLSFFTFRQDLITAARGKDTDEVFRHVAPDVQMGGGGSGLQNFKYSFRADADETWLRFVEVLEGGGSFVRNPVDRLRFCAPYIYSRYPDPSTLSDGSDGLVGEGLP